AGIGPEIAVKAAADKELCRLADIILYGCPDIINEAAKRFVPNVKLNVHETGDLQFSEVPIANTDAACGLAAHNAVIMATRDAIDGKIDAIVTAPMNKASVNLAGIPFTGHTELIAELCECDNFAMMQSDGDLRVAFVTTHIPLSEVASAITRERIVEVARLLENAIKTEGIKHPKLAAAAINPHAGENGYMGTRDEEVVKPALEELRSGGMLIDGPFPPDTLFIKSTRTAYDGILSMYHDQGHIPFKMLAFDRGVNSTLGLPIIRTSVDHGTAFEIAWQGVADTGSLFAAIKLAITRATNG
ncbi:MAG: 4-hydroxythreonine-4-phosphate dehydrogenase PdxA, partial [Victivallales bacterium]|nr:4-hydroxythreonine-4-phosphate dehydrogenase PdxA [Victivallales bacterium]